jgi:hypothetical protein
MNVRDHLIRIGMIWILAFVICGIVWFFSDTQTEEQAEDDLFFVCTDNMTIQKSVNVEEWCTLKGDNFYAYPEAWYNNTNMPTLLCIGYDSDHNGYAEMLCGIPYNENTSFIQDCFSSDTDNNKFIEVSENVCTEWTKQNLSNQYGRSCLILRDDVPCTRKLLEKIKSVK